LEHSFPVSSDTERECLTAFFYSQNRAGHCGTKNLSSPAAAQGRRPPGFFPGSPSGGFPRFPILKASFSSSLRKKIGCKSEDFFLNLKVRLTDLTDSIQERM